MYQIVHTIITTLFIYRCGKYESKILDKDGANFPVASVLIFGSF